MTILPVAPTATTTGRSPLDKKLRSSVSHDTARVPTAPTTTSDKMLYMPAANEKRNSRKGCNRRFKDRHDAGQQLSELLTYYSDKEAVVLAVPNNGVPIAYEISSHLRLPLRCFLFETIRRVEHPELYLGAISEPEGTLVKNQEIIESLNTGEREFQDLANEARSRLKQKTSEYCQAAVKPSTLAGKRVILVLDIEDAKSPALVRLIIRLLVSQTKGEPPKDLVVATPVISPDTIKMVKPHTGHAEGFVFDGSLQWVGVENDNFIGKNDDYYEDSESVTAEGVAHIIDIGGAN